MENLTSDRDAPSPIPVIRELPDRRPPQFSMAVLMWAMGAFAFVFGLSATGGFTGFLVAVSVLLIVLLWKTAPPSNGFQKVLVILWTWGWAVFGWRLFYMSGTMRFLAWRAEAEVVATLGVTMVALAIAGYFVLYKR